MNQLSIQYEPRLARSSDPITSKKAAAKVKHFAPSHESRILEALQTHGARSARELEQLIGLSVVQIDRRIAEMRRKVLIKAATDDLGTALVIGGCAVWEAV
jgi:peptide subunit release factor 1 (eRF1)